SDLAVPCGAMPVLECLRGRRAGGREQLIDGEELDESLRLLERRLQCRLRRYRGYKRARLLVLGPAREKLELQPADLEEGVPDRIEDAPGRRAVAGRVAGIKAKILTQRRQRHRLRCRGCGPCARPRLGHSMDPPVPDTLWAAWRAASCDCA